MTAKVGERQLLSAANVFLVKDVQRAAEHYRDVLGFENEGFFGEPPDFCMVWRDGYLLAFGQDLTK